MKGSLSLGSVSGIKIQIHWSFLLLIAYVIYLESSRGSDTFTILLTILFVLTIFGCVVLHELGHALTAKHYGISTKKITLLPIGGVASLERMPEEPKRELLIAVMGPMVNVVIALLLYLLFILLPSLPTMEELLQQDAEEVFATITAENFLYYLFAVNVMLVLFNAIPAFPMDGGRVLRALLSMRLDRVQATQMAARLGQFIAVIFFVLGFMYNPFLILIAIFVFFGAYGENMMVQHLTLLSGYKVRDALMTNFTKLHTGNSVQDAIDELLAGSEHHFIVVDETGEKVLGIVSQSRLIQSLKQGVERSASIKSIMDTQFETMDINYELSEVYRKAQMNRKNFFPVLDQGRLAGVINMENINEFMMIQGARDY